MKPLALVILCLLSVGCNDEYVKAVQKTKWGEEPSVTLGEILDHRPVCKETTWSSEKVGNNTQVRYTCEMGNYDNHFLRIVNRDMMQHEKDTNKMIAKYKEDMEISDFRLDQLLRLEKALDELAENGVAELYKTASEKLNMNNLDYTYVFKGPVAPIVPVEGYDNEAQKNLYTALKIIQETFLRHGLVKESYAHIGLNRSKTKNVDYLKIRAEDRAPWFTYDRNLITQRKIAALNALKALEADAPKQIDLYDKLGNNHLVTEIKQNVVYTLVDNVPVPTQCQFHYVTFNHPQAITDDGIDMKQCLHMAYASSYDNDFQGLFNRIYAHILSVHL